MKERQRKNILTDDRSELPEYLINLIKCWRSACFEIKRNCNAPYFQVFQLFIRGYLRFSFVDNGRRVSNGTHMEMNSQDLGCTSEKRGLFLDNEAQNA